MEAWGARREIKTFLEEAHCTVTIVLCYVWCAAQDATNLHWVVAVLLFSDLKFTNPVSYFASSRFDILCYWSLSLEAHHACLAAPLLLPPYFKPTWECWEWPSDTVNTALGLPALPPAWLTGCSAPIVEGATLVNNRPRLATKPSPPPTVAVSYRLRARPKMWTRTFLFITTQPSRPRVPVVP